MSLRLGEGYGHIGSRSTTWTSCSRGSPRASREASVTISVMTSERGSDDHRHCDVRHAALPAMTTVAGTRRTVRSSATFASRIRPGRLSRDPWRRGAAETWRNEGKGDAEGGAAAARPGSCARPTAGRRRRARLRAPAPRRSSRRATDRTRPRARGSGRPARGSGRARRQLSSARPRGPRRSASAGACWRTRPRVCSTRAWPPPTSTPRRRLAVRSRRGVPTIQPPGAGRQSSATARALTSMRSVRFSGARPRRVTPAVQIVVPKKAFLVLSGDANRASSTRSGP